MGNILDGCAPKCTKWTSTVYEAPTYERESPSTNGLGRVHVIIFAADYVGTDREYQSCVKDAKAMADLARTHCGVTSIIEHYDCMCTAPNLEHAFAQVSKKMQNDDFLVFFFAGHGGELDGNITREDSYAFDDGEIPVYLSLLNSAGAVVPYSGARLAELIARSINPKARILMMFDCDTSLPIVELTNPKWDDLEAISLSSINDDNDPANGHKIFVKSILYAVQSLQKQGDKHYSVGAIFNKMVSDGDRVTPGEDLVRLEHSFAVTTGAIAWPLLPTTKYTPNMQANSKMKSRVARSD
jgi:hypothetical protein